MRKVFIVSVALLIFIIALSGLFVSVSTRLDTILYAFIMAGAVLVCSVINVACFRASILKENQVMEQNLSAILNGSEIKPHPQALKFEEIDERIRDAEKNLRVMNSYIAHEMRNLLAVLAGKIQCNYNTEQILSTIYEINRSMDDILALFAVRTDDNELIDPAMVCAVVTDDYRETFPNICFELQTSVSSVYGKPRLLYSAVSNLVNNAIKFGDGGKIAVTVTQKENTVVICVENSGKGISHERVNNAFYYQNRLDELKNDGYGIGLSLVRNVVEVLGGIVWVRSEDCGTKFYLGVPAC